MEKWQMRYKGDCPFCSTPKEDTLHMLQCSHQDSIDHWTSTINSVLRKLVTLDTCPLLMVAVRNELRAWRIHQNLPNITLYPITLQQAILEQRTIGWKQFMEGFFTKSWGTYMSNYYKSTRSLRKGSTWIKRLMKYNWEAVFSIWENRYKQLHNTQQIKELEGLSVLQNAIRAEWGIGLGRLPASQFSHYFKTPLPQLLQKSMDSQKHWLMIIRQGQILIDPTNLLQDQFAQSRALKQWIDISYEVTDEEGLPILIQAVTEEWTLGLDSLCPQAFAEHFSDTLNNLLSQPSEQLKLWFIEVREARKTTTSSQPIQDDFSYPGALRSWVGLH